MRTVAAETSEPAPPRIMVRPIAVAPALVPATIRPSLEPVFQQVVDPGADQRAELGLVAAAEEDAGGGRQDRGGLIAVRVAAAAEPQLAGVFDAQLAEHALVVGVDLLGHVGGGRDQDYPGVLAAGELDEPVQQAGPAASVLSAADDQEATWGSAVVHVLALVPGPSRS